jgi:hypothetical protein
MEENKTKTLQECKDEVARKYGYKTWNDLESNGFGVGTGELLQRCDEAAELYTKSEISELITLTNQWGKECDGWEQRYKDLKKENAELREALRHIHDLMENNVPPANSKIYGPWIDERKQLKHILQKHESK